MENKINIENKIKTRLLGFSLVEMLVVIAIIGVMASVAVPKIGQLNETAKLTKNLRNAQTASSMIASALVAGACQEYFNPDTGANEQGCFKQAGICVDDESRSDNNGLDADLNGLAKALVIINNGCTINGRDGLEGSTFSLGGLSKAQLRYSLEQLELNEHGQVDVFKATATRTWKGDIRGKAVEPPKTAEELAYEQQLEQQAANQQRLIDDPSLVQKEQDAWAAKWAAMTDAEKAVYEQRWREQDIERARIEAEAKEAEEARIAEYEAAKLLEGIPESDAPPEVRLEEALNSL